jgi:hypothetical protein
MISNSDSQITFIDAEAASLHRQVYMKDKIEMVSESKGVTLHGCQLTLRSKKEIGCVGLAFFGRFQRET